MTATFARTIATRDSVKSQHRRELLPQCDVASNVALDQVDQNLGERASLALERMSPPMSHLAQYQQHNSDVNNKHAGVSCGYQNAAANLTTHLASRLSN